MFETRPFGAYFNSTVRKDDDLVTGPYRRTERRTCQSLQQLYTRPYLYKPSFHHVIDPDNQILDFISGHERSAGVSQPFPARPDADAQEASDLQMLARQPCTQLTESTKTACWGSSAPAPCVRLASC